jgi:thioredoxin-related protein
MKNIFAAVLVLFVWGNSFAQDEKEFWFYDLEEAESYAALHEVPILVVFAGSDWCRPCMRLKKDILTTEVFSNYAKDKLTILYLDFPMRKENKLPEDQTKHNEQLADKYNDSGAFPYILMLDKNEKTLGKIAFKNQSPEEFIADCEKLNP